MTVVYAFIAGIYILALTYITVFALFQFRLLHFYRKFWKKGGIAPPRPVEEADLPFVTV